MNGPLCSVVVPTVGRDSLHGLVRAVGAQIGPRRDVELIVVDDRRGGVTRLAAAAPAVVVRGEGRGPAAARNAGWRAARGAWIAFLDDDVQPSDRWLADLEADLGGASAGVGGVAGRVRAPLPPGPPDDWQRETQGLASAKWISADIAYRRDALEAVGGFDERFPRAYREDADLAYRVREAGWSLAKGRREVTHPPRPEGRWISLARQRGNADDALLRRLYGRRWHELLEAPRGRRRRHLAVTGAALIAVIAGAAGRPALALAGGAGWLAGTAEFTAHRFRRAPGSARQLPSLIATSVLIPPAAVVYWCAGWWKHRRAAGWDAGEGAAGPPLREAP
jgi:glycosyltransferase involved in cell wall biosynthesis